VEVPECIDNDSEDDSDSDLDVSTDGQIGRGINRDERQEIADYITRYGRITQQPDRLMAGQIQIPENNKRYDGQTQCSEQCEEERSEKQQYTQIWQNRDSGRNVPISKKKNGERERGEQNLKICV
jgi:hypothetical protein